MSAGGPGTSHASSALLCRCLNDTRELAIATIAAIARFDFSRHACFSASVCSPLSPRVIRDHAPKPDAMSAVASSSDSNRALDTLKAPAAAVQPLAPAPNGVASTASILPSDKPIDAPEHCPGTESVDAGKASACEGCANQDACQSAPKGPDPDLPEVARRMSSIKHKILVLSGKGGVGKVSS